MSNFHLTKFSYHQANTCRDDHTRLLVEPVSIPDLEHTGLQTRLTQKQYPPFYPNGKKNINLRHSIRDTLRSHAFNCFEITKLLFLSCRRGISHPTLQHTVQATTSWDSNMSGSFTLDSSINSKMIRSRRKLGHGRSNTRFALATSSSQVSNSSLRDTTLRGSSPYHRNAYLFLLAS
jgi:hypothetical protein